MDFLRLICLHTHNFWILLFFSFSFHASQYLFSFFLYSLLCFFFASVSFSFHFSHTVEDARQFGDMQRTWYALVECMFERNICSKAIGQRREYMKTLVTSKTNKPLDIFSLSSLCVCVRSYVSRLLFHSYAHTDEHVEHIFIIFIAVC